jgi:hypothetical protein
MHLARTAADENRLQLEFAALGQHPQRQRIANVFAESAHAFGLQFGQCLGHSGPLPAKAIDARHAPSSGLRGERD